MKEFFGCVNLFCATHEPREKSVSDLHLKDCTKRDIGKLTIHEIWSLDKYIAKGTQIKNF